MTFSFLFFFLFISFKIMHYLCYFLSHSHTLTLTPFPHSKLEAEQLDVVQEILKNAFDLKDGESSAVRLVEIFPAEEEAAVPIDEEKWEEFLKVISDKGYFNGCDEGSAEFAERKEKARAKYIARSNPYEGMSPDQLKGKGNELMQKGQHKTAIGYYSKAIELDATNAVFYANRAAAYTHLNQYSEAVRDCEKATQIKPDYSKAFSRLGTAHFYMQNFAGAVGAFQSAADLEPENEGYKQDLLSAQQKLSAAPAGGAGGMPGGMPGMPGFDFGQMGQMMANPQFQQMAQSVMQNPAFGSMMENMAKNMGGGAGGPGGMPDMAQMANMWGGEGGAAGMPGMD